jgi:hypothetical protein
MKHKKNLLKSAKARVTGTIPYCPGKVPHSAKDIYEIFLLLRNYKLDRTETVYK